MVSGILVEAFDDDVEDHSIFSQTRPSNYPIFLLSQNNSLEIIAKYSGDEVQNKTFMLSARTAKVTGKRNLFH